MITAGTKGLSMGINKAQGMLRDLNRTAKGVQRDMGKAFNGIGGIAGRAFTALGAAATAAAGGLAYLTKNSIEAIGDANDFAKSVGLSYNQLRRLQKAAQLSGVDLATMNVALMKMSDVLGTAFGGNEAAIKTFKNIGLSVEDLAKMNPEQQFVAIAEAINKIQDPSQKIAAARDVFGRSGGALISFFGNVRSDMQAAGDALQLFGVTLNSLDVEKIDAAGDAMGEFAFIVEGIGNQLARIVAPYILQISQDTVAWLQQMGGVGPAVDAAFGGVLDKLDQVMNKIDAINNKWQNFIGGAQGIIGEGFAIADKAAEKIGSKTVSDAVKAEETNRRLQGIPEHRREQARALLEKQGGFASESIDAGTMAEAFGAASAERASSAAASDARINGGRSYGDAFRNWREKADYNANIAAGMTPIAQQTPGARVPRDREDPALQVLRNIEANTGKNKIAFAG